MTDAMESEIKKCSSSEPLFFNPISTARPKMDELGLLVQGVDDLEPKKPLTDP